MSRYLTPETLLARTSIMPTPQYREFKAKELRDQIDGWQSTKELANLRINQMQKELKRRRLKI